MHSFLILGIVLLMVLVNTAPVADGTSSDGFTPELEDQLDSGLNFQPLPKIVTILSPAKADPEPITATKSGSTTKPVGSTANSELNPHSGNATSPELASIKPGDPNTTGDYFQENDFKCSKEASFIGCCDGGDFDKCETFGAQKPICKKTKNMSCCHQVPDVVLLSKPNAYKCDSKAIQLSGPLLH